jgi:hypothetical protein
MMPPSDFEDGDDDIDDDEEDEKEVSTPGETSKSDSYRQAAIIDSIPIHPLPALTSAKKPCPFCGCVQESIDKDHRCVRGVAAPQLCKTCKGGRCPKTKYTHLVQSCVTCHSEWLVRPHNVEAVGVFLHPENEEDGPVSETKIPGTPSKPKRRNRVLRVILFMVKLSAFLTVFGMAFAVILIMILRRLLPQYCGG